jgi:hypothetical protein
MSQKTTTTTGMNNTLNQSSLRGEVAVAVSFMSHIK